MKKNQPDPDPDMDRIEPARLASFGVLVGLLIVGGFVLLLTLSSGARTPKGNEPKPEARPAVEVRDDAAQRAGVVPTPETPKAPANKPEGKKRAASTASPKPSRSAKPYVISVAPGRTPRMTQVQ
jgi:hypothetical protein